MVEFGAQKPSLIRILHLEDNEQDAELVAYAMEAEGMDVSIRRVVDKAGYLEALRAGAFDLILSDHSLPAFNGSEALELAKEIRPDLPLNSVQEWTPVRAEADAEGNPISRSDAGPVPKPKTYPNPS